MQSISLDGEWQVRPELFSIAGEAGLSDVLRQPDGWLPAQVPGEIHLDLMRAGQMPDPSVSTSTAPAPCLRRSGPAPATSSSADDPFIATNAPPWRTRGIDQSSNRPSGATAREVTTENSR